MTSLDPAWLRARLAAADSALVRVVRAPGRVNLIGEHTDYNDGYVVPAAIGLETWIAVVPRDDRRVDITLASSGERDGFSLDSIGPRRGTWIDYVAGMAESLSAAGAALRGFRGVLASTLPVSAGLSSSAALELAAAWALCEEPRPPFGPMRVARLAQRAENDYVGVRCGLLDQFSSAMGQPGAALLLDCRSLEWRPVALPMAEHVLVAIDSGSPRRLAASDYNARRAECEAAVRGLALLEPGVRSLRDVPPEMLDLLGGHLAPVERRRAEHVVGENARVLTMVSALEAGDMETVGRCMAESHASLRDNYEVSSPALDALVEIAGSVEGVVGARMTGAGFGGCTVNIVRREAVEALTAAVADHYPGRTGLQATVHVVEPVAGAGVVEG